MARPPPTSEDALHADIVILLNLVARLLADLSSDVIRAGSFTSVQELVDDINAYLGDCNASPKPHTSTTNGKAILKKIHRARAALVVAEAA